MYFDILPLKSKYHFCKVVESSTQDFYTALGKFVTSDKGSVLELNKNSFSASYEEYEKVLEREGDCPLVHVFEVETRSFCDSDTATGERYEVYYHSSQFYPSCLFHFTSEYRP